MASPQTRVPASCPTCGARAEEGQLVCLECGSRVALGYRRPPDWRVPVAIVAGVVLLAVVGAAMAFKEIGDEADQEVSRTPIKVKEPKLGDSAEKKKAAGASRSTAKQPEAEKEPAERKRPATRKKPATEKAPAAPATGAGLVKRGILYRWPRDLKAFTVVLLSAEDRTSAENFARSATKGMPARIGVIRADDFESLPNGFYIVFAGSYKDRARADKAAARLGKRFSGAFPQLVER